MNEEMNSVVCPNCGASTSNFRNCEYCGSFLVQKASEGVELSSYKAIAGNYSHPALLASIKEFITRIQMPHQEDISLDVINPNSSNKWIIDGVPTETPAVVAYIGANKDDELASSVFGNSGIHILLSFLGSDNPTLLHNRFVHSNLYQVARAFSETGDRDITGCDAEEIIYYFDFGNDAEGACQVALQIADQVYGIDYQSLTCEISKSNDTNDSSIFSIIPRKWLIIGGIVLFIIYLLW